MKYIKKIVFWGLLFTIFAGAKTASATEFEIKDNVVIGVTDAETTITIPEGVTAIGNKALKGNQTITRVFIPEGVTKIGKEAFQNCKNLNLVILPTSITSIGKNAFKNASSYIFGPVIGIESGLSKKVIRWLYNNELQYKYYTYSENGSVTYTDELRKYPWLGTKWNKQGVRYQVTKKTDTVREVKAIDLATIDDKNRKKTEITIPATITLCGKKYKVTAIGKKAFQNEKKLKKVVIGKNVRVVKKRAFANCKSLQSITIRNPKLRYQGKGIWKGIDRTLQIKLPKKGYQKQVRRLKKSGFPF